MKVDHANSHALARNARDRMEKRGFNGVVVVEDEQGRVAGFCTRQTYTWKTLALLDTAKDMIEAGLEDTDELESYGPAEPE